MKKLALILSAGILAVLLVACGTQKKDEATEPTNADGTTNAEVITILPTKEDTEADTDMETEEEEVLLGGWQVAESDLITEIRGVRFDQATADLEAEGVDCHPIMYIGSQIVNGTNYCYIADITDVFANKNYFALVFIHEDLDGNVQLVNIHELEDIEYANEYDFVGDNFGQYFNETTESEE